MDDRIIKLLGDEFIERIQNTSILLIGLGGVGGYAFESLVRSKVQHITIIDFDNIEESNLNRQILSLNNNIGNNKCEEASIRAHLINKDIDIKIINKKLTKEDITEDLVSSYDYILDACDTVEVKVELMKVCSYLKKKLISCMGTANKTHPELLEIVKLKNTINDPLAKKIRSLLKDNKNILNTYVVCSKEIPKKQKDLGTICAVPMAAGALLSSYIINDIKKELD